MKNLKKGEFLDILLRSEKTVFSAKDIALLWGKKSESAARVRLSYYVKNKNLLRIRKGLYSKDNKYNKNELATKIFTPSYISFETVLAKSGVNFQFYSQIFIASYITRELVIDGQVYSYKRVREPVLSDHTGIEAKDGYHIASPERAFLDIVYLNKNYHFDNLATLNWEKINDILPIYNNKSMEKRVKKYRDSVK
jgi:hypothetical protein